MIVSPLVFGGACILSLVIGGIITPVAIFSKIPEARFFTWLRLRKAIWVRVHHSNDIEVWYDGYLQQDGLVVQDRTGKAIAINPMKLNRGKNSYHQGKNIIDVGSQSLWPVGMREGLLVDAIEGYVQDEANGCRRLKGMELLTRHTLLHSKDAELPSKIAPLINIDPGTISSTLNLASMDDGQRKQAFEAAYMKAVSREIKEIIDEVHKVKTALEGKVVFDEPFSWADACFTVNSQLQPEIYSKLKMILEKLAYDADKNKEKFWMYVIAAMLVLGVIIIGILAVTKYL